MASGAASVRRSRPGYDPSPLGKAWLVVWEQVFCTWLVVAAGLPFLWDVFKTNVLQRADERLPGSIADLLDAKTFSRLSGRAVSKVEYSVRLEQHANSTDRAWFKVRFEGEREDTFIFAKVHAKNFLVRAIMSLFDVYRNELHAYAAVKMPVRVPAVYIAQWSRSRFCLAMEDLRHEKVVFPNLWETTLDAATAKRFLTTLATIHAKFWNNAPHGCWDDTNRPYQGKVMGMYTLRNVERSCPGLISDDMHAAFTTALWHYDKIRAFYSRPGAKTMVHGDTHTGNFFIQGDQVGTFDFQVKSEEHPMRDVTYFLSSSYPEEHLARDEKMLINFYRDELARLGVPKDQVPGFDECWLHYRMQTWYTLYAFVFSGGFADLMDEYQTRVGVKRIVAMMDRVDAAGALYDMLDGKI
jgi:hypothetical protein